MPAGVSSNFNNGNITISGTPTSIGTYNYTVTLEGGCGDVSAQGTITVNACSGEEEEMRNQECWHIYPNPTEGRFTIGSEDGGEFELLDVMGQVIEEMKVGGVEYTVDYTLPAGVYFIRNRADGSTRKLIVQ